MPPKRKVGEMTGESTPLNWAHKKVTELKAELSHRQLSTAGLKAELAARLSDDDALQQRAGATVINGTNWNSLPVAKLKEELGTRGLSNIGSKADLVARIEKDNADLSSRVDDPSPQSSAQTATPEESDNDMKGKGIDAQDGAVYAVIRTIAQLKLALEERGLASTGKKPDLIARLKAYEERVLNPEPLAADVIVHQQVNFETGERRARSFVPAPDAQFLLKLERIRTERMFMLDRRLSQDKQGYPSQTFDIAGSTGNIYKVAIGRSPSCDCMDARTRGNKCKHINCELDLLDPLYAPKTMTDALIVVLKAPSHLQYQLAFLTDEPQSMFENAPITQAPDDGHGHDHVFDDGTNNGIRKPVEGDCCICVIELDAAEELVWCKAACGQNFHKECFEQWRKSKRGAKVTCVYCRIEWQDASLNKLGPLARLKNAAPKVGSYKNIGHHSMYRDEETGK